MFLEIFIKYTYLFTLKKLLLNNLVTLDKDLTLENKKTMLKHGSYINF